MSSSEPVDDELCRNRRLLWSTGSMYMTEAQINSADMDTPLFLGNLQCHLAYVPSTTRRKIEPLTHSALAVGSLSIPLARLGAKVASSDISAAMTGEAAERAKVGKRTLELSRWSGLHLRLPLLGKLLSAVMCSDGVEQRALQ